MAFDEHGYWYVNDGETSSGLHLAGSQTLVVSSGGSADIVAVSSGGTVRILSGGTATNIAASSGAIMSFEVASGTCANGLYNNSGFEMKNGQLTGYTINPMCELSVFGGGILRGTIADSGSLLLVSTDGTAEGVKVRGAQLDVSDGGSVKEIELLSDGQANVSRTASVNSVIVHETTRLSVASGGTATLVQEKGGFVEVEDGAEVTFLENTLNGLELSDFHSASVHSGTTAYDTTVDFNGAMYIGAGGSAYNTMVKDGGVMLVTGGGSADGIGVDSNGVLYISNGATATGIIASRGAILNLGIAPDTRIQGEYDGSSFEFEDALISGWTVRDLGELSIFDGGRAVDITTDRGFLTVFSGGSASGIAVNNNGELRLIEGAVNDATINKSSYITVYSGSANNIFLNDANLLIYSGGTAGDVSATLQKYAAEDQWWGGNILQSPGILLASGGKLTGNVTLDGEAKIYAYEGGIVDFDLTRATAGADALLNDMSKVLGAPVYTLTVGATPTDGIYALADNAIEFKGTLSVVSTSGEELDSLAVGKTFKFKSVKYTLYKSAGTLYIAVSGGRTPGGDGSFAPDNGWNNYLYRKADGLNPEADEFVTSVLKEGGDTGIVLDAEGPLTVNEVTYGNFVGYADGADFGKISLEQDAKLSFGIRSTGTAKFVVYSLVENTGKKAGTFTMKALQTTSLKKNKATGLYTAQTKGLLLEAGDYYISMQSSNTKNGSAYYDVNLNEEENGTVFFTHGDNSDDWTDMKEKGAAGDEYADWGTLSEASDELADDWVGYGDAVDYARIHLDSGAKLYFRIGASDAAKFSVCSLTGKEKKGVTTYSLKDIQSAALKKAKGTGSWEYEAATKGILLEAGDYYISMQSTNAAKGGNAFYTVILDSESTFYPYADDGRNNYIYDKKQDPALNPDIKKFVTTAITSDTEKILLDRDSADTYGNWVGFGDAADCAKITLGSAAKLSFTLTGTDSAAKFIVYQLVEGKAGKYTLKALQTTVKLRKTDDPDVFSADTKALSLAAGDYFICMQSTNAAKGGSLFYDVTLNKALCENLPGNVPLSSNDTDMLAAPELDSAHNQFTGESVPGILAGV